MLFYVKTCAIIKSLKYGSGLFAQFCFFFFTNATSFAPLNAYSDLRNNRIVTISETIFRSLRRLQILYLNGNAIQLVTTGMIPVLNTLVTLSLASNRIRTVAADALMLPRLEHL